MSDKESSASEASASESSASSSASESSSSEAVKKDKKKKSKKEHKKEKKNKKHGKEKKKSKSKSKDKKDKKEKKEKKEKGGKRGPKGAQWMTWKIPYQEKSILGSAFRMALKKGGVDEKKLAKFIKKNKGTPAFILRGLKKGYSKGWSWEVDDAHGRLRIFHPKISDKHWKRG